ncbi:methyltransferase family protein [Eudoraea chungangensis]|uniref:methyltransferase family protein n=1 Tax=Eudoraea chungangensis TaxID=1481905 RepID=UPI0023EC5536|nr:isoprenylcysteine carboxylmethyltransferase family protein [Eudoraea chungangensis]
MDQLNLKIPPVLVFGIFALLMWMLNLLLPVGGFDFYGRIFFCKLFVILGIALGIISLLQFYKFRTTIHPKKLSKVSNLVTTGLYNFSRNPMYLGLLLFLLAWGLWLGNAFNILLAAGFVGYMNRFQISLEEKALLERFGKDYKNYCILVRRWF